MDDPTRDADELPRTMDFAALGFVAALLSGTITMAMLIAPGWRPYRLNAGFGSLWLSGTVVAAAGTVFLSWAGCPVTFHGMPTENKGKSLTFRVGIVLFLLGTAAASVVKLFSAALP